MHEAAASQLASLLSDDLVPPGKTAGGLAIVYPLVKVDSKATQAMFESRHPKHVKETLFPKLSDKQRAQVFVHAMTDLLLDNRDTHADQFAIDTNGNFIGFDKGRAFLEEVFERAPTLTSFDLKTASIDKSDIYAAFMVHLRNNTKDLKKLLSSEQVTKFFDALDTLSDEDLLAAMSPLFRYLDYRIKKEGIKSFTLADLQQKFVTRFRSLRPFLAKWLDVPASAFRSYYGSVDARVALNMKEDDGLRYITADLSKYDVKVISTNDFTENGANVLTTVQKTRALAGINGGYFQNTDVSALQNTYLGKALYYGLNIVRSHTGLGAELFKVFPSQILKTERDLIGDSGDFYPCFGWNLKTRDFIAGEVKTQWLVYPPKAQGGASAPLKIDRVSHYHYKNKLQFLYTGVSKIELNDGVISEISRFDRVPAFGTVPEYNSYKISQKADADKASSWLGALKVGDSLEIGYQLVGETAEETARWAKVDQVVNGQGVLVKNGVAQDVLKKNEGIGIPSGSEKTAICSTNDGKMMSFVAKSISFKDLANKAAKLGCHYALSLDGGQSTVMVVKVPEGDGYQSYISDRAISDVIVVLPKSRVQSSKIGDVAQQNIVPAIKAGNVELVKSALKKNPDLIYKKDDEGRSLLHVAIDAGAKSDFVVARFLIEFVENNPAYKTLLREKSFFNETPLVAATNRLDLVHPQPGLLQVVIALALKEDFSELDRAIQISLAHVAAKARNEKIADKVFELDYYSRSRVLEGCGDVVGELIKLSKKGAAWALENEKALVREYPEAKLFTREELAEIYAVGNSFVGLAIIKSKPEVAQKLVASMPEQGSSNILILSVQKGYGSLGKEIVKRFGLGFSDDDLKAVMPHLSTVDPTVAQDIVAGFSKHTLTDFLLKNPNALNEFTSGAFGAVIQNVVLGREDGYPPKTLAQLLMESIVKGTNGFDSAKFELVRKAIGSDAPKIVSKALLFNIPSLLSLDLDAFAKLTKQADLSVLQDRIYERSLGSLLIGAVFSDPNGFDSAKFELLKQALGSNAPEMVARALLENIPWVLSLDLDTFARLIQQADLRVLKDTNKKRSFGRLLLEGIVSDPNGVDQAKLEVVLDAARPMLKQLALEGPDYESKFLTELLLLNVEVAEKILIRLDDSTKAEIMNSLASARDPRSTPLYLLNIQDFWKDGRNHTHALGLVLAYMKPETIGMEIHPFWPFGFLMMNPSATAEAIGLMAKHTSADDLWKTANFKYYLAFYFLHNLANGKQDSEELIRDFEKEMLTVETNLEKLKSVHPETPDSASQKVAEDFEFNRNRMVAFYLKKVDRSVAFRVEEILRQHGLKFKGLDDDKE